MTALSITAANVGLTSENDGLFEKVKYGETITQGQSVYRNTTDEEYYLTDATTSAATADAAGIALTPGTDGEYGWIARDGATIDIGATVVVAETYIVGASGALNTIDDATSGWFKTVVAQGITTSSIKIQIAASGVAVP